MAAFTRVGMTSPADRKGQLVRRVKARLNDLSVDSERERWRERLSATEEQRLLARVRAGRDVCWTVDEAEPLVTVRISTYNRADLLMERALPTALAQSYERLEVLVIGDATDEATDKAMRSVADPRVKYLNLPARGLYPEDAQLRHRVAGSHPWNVALALAKGSWIAPLDDDDEFTEDHVAVLLEDARRRRLEMVYSVADLQRPSGVWEKVGEEPLRAGGISHGTVLYSLGLRFFSYSMTCHYIPEPNDWNLWRRMRDAGVRIGFLDRTTFVHHESPHG
ncbi:MAG TPA: glycosyltransferase family A protein [Aeromicrobium sp.]|nr:glycosyltransferase family A protein [Aeromicrobium sp.]